MHFRIGLIVLTLVLALSCDDTSECGTETDCFAGELCSGGTCVPGTKLDLGIGDTGVQDMNSSDSDHGNNVADMSMDQGEPDLPEDMSVDLEPMLACQVDPIESTCTDDMWEPNNAWINGEKLGPQVNLGPGCPTPNTFVPLDEVINPTMCARDASDWFYIEFTPCMNSAIRITWTMIPEQECRADLIALDSLSYPCGTEANCTATDEMAMVVIDLPATGQRQSQLSYVSIIGETGVQTPYELRVRVEQR